MTPDLERRDAHALLDMLPDDKISAVRNLLQVMLQPLSESLEAAPVEDEGLTPEAANAIERSRKSLSRGRGITHEVIRQEFGLKK